MTGETKIKHKEALLQSYSDSRIEKTRLINLNLKFSKEKKSLFSKIAKLRNSNEKLRKKLSFKLSKPITLYKKNGEIYKEYSGICKMSKEFSSCTKTINKLINNGNNFRDYGPIKLDFRGLNPITLYKFDGKVEKFQNITEMSIKYKCAPRTINNSINNKTIFKKIGHIKLDRAYKNEE